MNKQTACMLVAGFPLIASGITSLVLVGLSLSAFWAIACGLTTGLILVSLLTYGYRETIIDSIYSREKAELRQAISNAHKTAKAKTDFLSTMSHEIRTPLNAVIGMTHLLLDEEPRADQMPSLKVLKFSSENLMILVNDILDFNKIDSGHLEFEKKPVNLLELTEGIVASLDRKADENQSALFLDFDRRIKNDVIGDATRIGQILANLLSNAVKFTKNGIVRLSIDLIGESEDDYQIRFMVKDNGIGIPKNKMSQIFEAFQQAGPETTRKYGGTGLGLPITKKLLGLMNSQIEVSSELGKGSEFSFELVMKKGNASSRSVDMTATKNLENSLTGLKILLVEDLKFNQVVAGVFLRKWGIEYEVASNGQVALEKLQHTDYDLVLMDLQMPILNGYDATREIRRSSKQKHRTMPIIALTASALIDQKDKVFDAGMNDFVTKPFQPLTLYKTIAKYAGNGTNGQASRRDEIMSA